MPACARIGDSISHGGAIIEGSGNVFAEGLGVARMGDKVYCSEHELQTIVARFIIGVHQRSRDSSSAAMQFLVVQPS